MNQQILEGYSPAEKTAYLTAIASIATADQSASAEEIEYLEQLGEAAGLTQPEQQQVALAARDTSGEALAPALKVLQGSELRYALMAELMAFAEADQSVSEAEKQQIAGIGDYLNINGQQQQALSAFVKETGANPSSAQSSGGFLDNLGLGQQLGNSGINLSSLAKGLIPMIAPMLLGGLLNRGARGRGSSNMGGLGSLIGGLSGGRGFSGIGGVLSRMLR